MYCKHKEGLRVVIYVDIYLVESKEYIEKEFSKLNRSFLCTALGGDHKQCSGPGSTNRPLEIYILLITNSARNKLGITEYDPDPEKWDRVRNNV